MPLVPMTQLLADALAGAYAVCYCESWNLESLQAVLEAAEEERSPVIAGFNGGFLGHPARPHPDNVLFYAGMGAPLRDARVPVAFLLNETDDVVQIEQALAAGFNAVMVENEQLGMNEYQALVKKVIRLAHARGLAVEAQLGHLPGPGVPAADHTDARLAARFVEQTSVDALAVSVGNVHILTRGQASIDLDLLAEIRQFVKVPLVIHGGTGFPPELARDAIALGVAKINFGTVLKQTYLSALSRALAGYQEPANPHPFLGMGGKADILMAARQAVKEKVRALLRAYGSAGKATI